MSKIKSIEGRKILDSREKETVEVKVETDDGFVGIDSVPSGTSTGKHEAKLVDVDIACTNVNKMIAPEIIGKDPLDQQGIDNQMIKLDGTENKDRIGANAILGVSLAIARAAAASQKIPLYKHINNLFRKITTIDVSPKMPTPMMVMICGGMHAGNNSDTEQKISIQEFSVLGSIDDGIKIWHKIESYFRENNIEYTIGLEGAFSPNLKSNEESLDVLKNVISQTKNDLKSEVKIALDVAGNNCPLTSSQLIDLYNKYDIYSFEDPFGEEDWEKFGQFKLELEETKKPFMLIGDDLFATHKSLLQKGITNLVANGIIIKPNQVGTLSEVFEVMKIAYDAKFNCIVSHRSGETSDTFISDLAVGTAAGYLKAGAPIPSERLAKYNRLKEIEQELTK